MTETNGYDIIVIGAGMAGASAAAELAREARVLMLEMESQPGYHTTGRSAAMFAPTYGPQPIRALTRASEAFFHTPGDGFANAPLVSPRGVLMIARKDQMAALDTLIDQIKTEGTVERLNPAETLAMNPLLRPGYAAGAMLDRDTADIDVNALHQGYLRTFATRHGKLATKAEVLSLTQNGGTWTVQTAAGSFCAPVVVNAAGAWADQIGHAAGAEKIGLVPKRRTALIIPAPDGIDPRAIPLSVDIDEQFYLKPDAGRLLISPANEDPDQPSDVQPDEMDIAICIDRIERAFDLKVARIENRWAGLRSFVADKAPVIGYSQIAEGFFWLAGQGGYGIQTAPAISRLVGAMVYGRSVPADITQTGFAVSSVAPERLAGAPN